MSIIYFIYRYFCIPIIVFIRQLLVRLRFPKTYISPKAIVKIGNNGCVSIGNNCSINKWSYIVVTSQNENAASLTIGDNTYIGEFNNIRVAGGRISIGKNCLISQHITMVSSNHVLSSDKLIVEQPWSTSNNFIIVEDGVWIGANSVILPGVTIGKGAVIAAGSIVTHDVAPMTIAAGNPAKFLKNRI